MMNPVPWLQMTNMISYQGLVRTFPKATVKFDGVVDGDDATHFANMAASNASQNIALQITNDSHTTTYKNQDQMTITINSSTGKGEFPLAARLYSTQGGATIGQFESVVQLTFTYQ
ncbi:hypothetical protein [Klebsiella sp. RHBSTW-00215]|uniref:fimbrial protein n=1 Tax=Klebsiella sp. RHBSTW-00215 TaxID=2742640 RepID=UPI001E39451D|nr:hypothetical protein [Klebsiella sp. RHBSTW-00215]